MKLSQLARDKCGWIRLPCGALVIEADEFVQAEHVPYCATCAGQIDHVSSVTASELDAQLAAYSVWCYCYSTPEPKSWIFPDDVHADTCGFDLAPASTDSLTTTNRQEP